MEAVRKGEVWGTLYFTENFTDALVARMALGKDSDDETLDQSEIRVWLDMSSKHSFDSSVNLILYILFSAHIVLRIYDYNIVSYIYHFSSLTCILYRRVYPAWHLLIACIEISHLHISLNYLSFIIVAVFKNRIINRKICAYILFCLRRDD